MSTIERYASLASRLYSLTIEKGLNWSAGPFDNSLECELGGYTVSIEETEDGSGNPYVIVRIKNSSGNIIDSFTDETIRNEPTNLDEKPTYWLLLSDLVFQAHRQVSGADDALDAILRDLNSK